HQFVRVGAQAMIGGTCGVRGDVIPYGFVTTPYSTLEGLNVVGMKLRNFSRARVRLLHGVYKALFHGAGLFAERLAAVRARAAEDPAIAEIVDFIDKGEQRSLCLPWERAQAS